MKTYKKRVCDEILTEELSVMGAVLIEGAKWCGKTTTAEHLAKSAFYMDEYGKSEENRLLARTAPKRILDGEPVRLIDEWQIAPELWDAVRYAVDHGESAGRFILTGSSVPPDIREVNHSGAGRFAWVKMRPMTLFESGDSSGEASLEDLFKAADISGATSQGKSLEEIAYLACRGGWPKVSAMYSQIALNVAFSYLEAIVKTDISRVDNVDRNEERTRRVMRSYARLQGTQASASVIRADIAANETSSLTEATVCSYINALKRLFVIEDMGAWSINLRNKTTIRTSDTRYFTDPSIATSAMGLGPEDLMNDLKTFGFVFETMAVRDLRVYAQRLHGSVAHYKDASGLECDGVVHLRNGDYGLVEIKLGGNELIEKGAQTLKKLAGRIDTTKSKKPSFMMVLTAVGEFVYRREDGVYVVPITALK